MNRNIFTPVDETESSTNYCNALSSYFDNYGNIDRGFINAVQSDDFSSYDGSNRNLFNYKYMCNRDGVDISINTQYVSSGSSADPPCLDIPDQNLDNPCDGSYNKYETQSDGLFKEDADPKKDAKILE